MLNQTVLAGQYKWFNKMDERSKKEWGESVRTLLRARQRSKMKFKRLVAIWMDDADTPMKMMWVYYARWFVEAYLEWMFLLVDA